VISEDLNVFLDDFGVSCTAGAVTALGILDTPSQVVADGMVLTTDYRLTAKTSDFGTLKYGDSISVNGVSYQVRENVLLDDGQFCDLYLQRT
jgi:riboflavin synthase alpha subunit